MVTEVSAVQFRQNPGEMLLAVQSQNTSTLVEENGKPLAALVDPITFESIRRLDSDWKRLRSEVAEAFEDIPEEQGMAIIQAICVDVRHGR
jgi:PHD/YefM family antitoxin component YafN of YafNO toxin-antitoxin module